ncbi:MAG TPA: hypothetical protein VFQ45_13870 [Longimicrobium sp.]|nr:hypothetical protein [Longimicrobium sp.]
MNRIRLDPEELVVESFATAAGKDEKAGTVHGHAATEWPEGGCDASDGSYCGSCGYGGHFCPQDTMTCLVSCLMTDGNAACLEPNCTGG